MIPILFAIVIAMGTLTADAALALDTAFVVQTDSVAVRLRIDGMTCGGCAVSARLVLERVEGVRKATVDYDSKTAVVTYDPSKTAPEKMIVALKQKLKYTATIVLPKAIGS